MCGETLAGCERRGVGAIINDWSLYDDFREVYRQTMNRKHTSPYYHFPDWYFSKLREVAGDHLILISIISDASDPHHASQPPGQRIKYFAGVSMPEMVDFFLG